MSVEPESLTPPDDSAMFKRCGWKTMRAVTWVSVGMAVAALGIYLGNELRCRAKFKKRTPYDFYANAGESAANEFGVGI
ncbi:MAG TPA: hypothetical protein VHX20_09075 [Terracidiphilus sp.]|nr:hypothetical protein [Terracidiphilus sp.]